MFQIYWWNDIEYFIFLTPVLVYTYGSPPEQTPFILVDKIPEIIIQFAALFCYNHSTRKGQGEREGG